MNNSKIAIENTENREDTRLSFLQKQKGELTLVVEAINRVEASEDWQKLKGLIWDGLVEKLERLLLTEVGKDAVDLPKIYRLQGQVEWARKYADLKKLSDEKRTAIETIKNLIKHESNPRDGAL